MNDPRPIPDAATPAAPPDGERAGAMRAALARGDAVLGSAPAVLRHLIAHDDGALFADDVIARTRGMLADLAAQIGDVLAGGERGHGHADPTLLAAVEAALVAIPGLLSHCHATAIEWQATEALQSRLQLDPVLSPLVEALIASPDAEIAAAAMKMLAAQARFVQRQRQMRLPIGELPPDVVHAVIAALAPVDEGGSAAAAIRARYDESASRLGLLARLVTSMGAGAIAALAIGHGGFALFATTMAIACDLPRDACVLLVHEQQTTRLALALRAAGLRAAVIEENLLALHPGALAPFGIAAVSPERAAALLAASALGGAAAGAGLARS